MVCSAVGKGPTCTPCQAERSQNRTLPLSQWLANFLPQDLYQGATERWSLAERDSNEVFLSPLEP